MYKCNALGGFALEISQNLAQAKPVFKRPAHRSQDGRARIFNESRMVLLKYRMTAQRKNLGEDEAQQRNPPIVEQIDDGCDRQYVGEMMQSLIDRILVACNEMGFCFLVIRPEVAQGIVPTLTIDESQRRGKRCKHDITCILGKARAIASF